ncbi:MAG: hypothetical protein AUK44_05150 [Porphyromonadaceae bacterium CG2_30_38_12]|nr:MAG: hypothetical protein AUK44_05150 [Porphyromonadaceae bacterium CG2_30_38_12]
MKQIKNSSNKRRSLRKLFLACALIVVFTSSWAQNESNTAMYSPRIEGTIRAKYEYFTDNDEHRFQVRNARFSVRGKISPLTFYKAEIDLSDEGKTKMLDAYLQLKPQKNWSFTIGQQKVPFSTDNLRSPHELYLANRSFINKQLVNLRDVGLTFNYVNSKLIPYNFTAGVFNGTGLYVQDKTMKLYELSYVARLILLDKDFKIQLNANTINPGEVRMNFYSGGLMYDNSYLHLETEYLYKNYSPNTNFTPANTWGYYVLGSYNIYTPKAKNVRKISPVIRYEGMTKNIRYDVQSATTIALKTDAPRTRLTVGLIISLAKPFKNDIRLNYEHYSWEDGHKADSKLVAEFVVKF